MLLWLLNLYLTLPRCFVASLAVYIYSEHLSTSILAPSASRKDGKRLNHKTAIINMKLIILVSVLMSGVTSREKRSVGVEVLWFLPRGGRSPSHTAFNSTSAHLLPLPLQASLRIWVICCRPLITLFFKIYFECQCLSFDFDYHNLDFICENWRFQEDKR